jgi:hypothetical protein
VFTQTIPGPGVPCAVDEDAVFVGAAEAGWLGAAGLASEAGVEALVLVAAAAAAAPSLTVTSGAIFLMVRAARPAFDKVIDGGVRPARNDLLRRSGAHARQVLQVLFARGVQIHFCVRICKLTGSLRCRL